MTYDRHADLPVWRLEFEDYPGLVVRVRPPSANAYIAAEKAARLLATGRRQDLARALAALAGPFADALVSWTLLNAGRPVPATRTGVLRQDLEFAGAIVSAWTQYAGGPPATGEPELDAELEAGLSMQPLDAELEAVAS